jgi:hypothetical protein
MHKLSKTAIAQRQALYVRLRDAYAALSAALDAFNADVQHAWAAVDSAQEEYNAVTDDVADWMRDIASQIEAYMSERSEKWQDSARGQAYADWQGAYEQELETVALEPPEELTLDTDDPCEVLDGLPEAIDLG